MSNIAPSFQDGSKNPHSPKTPLTTSTAGPANPEASTGLNSVNTEDIHLVATPLSPIQQFGNARPSASIRHVSAPAHRSPIHHRQRRLTARRQVKETLDAKTKLGSNLEDGSAEERINQYIIKQEIGRGSFGLVHLAVDDQGQEYAVKVFSKNRLRRKERSNLLKTTKHTPHHSGYSQDVHAGHKPGDQHTPSHTRQHFAGEYHFSPPGSPHHSLRWATLPEHCDSVNLIRQEIAIMKKLDHPNLVSLIEVLDDPSGDQLFMVMEMCKKGPVMNIERHEKTNPLDNEQYRIWFRDMILGIEYLHAQGCIHRDIKPDNCLLTSNNMLKIADFGVSEMFESDSNMQTTKYAGSPAYISPELCQQHREGGVSGTACDIWSMGVTLYCLAFGTIPFDKMSLSSLYEAIQTEAPHYPDDCDPQLRDLLTKLLEKDPQKRIQMDEIRVHPWVTLSGSDLLLPKEENVLTLLEPPTQEEVEKAITAPLNKLVTVLRAATRFKRLLKQRPIITRTMSGGENYLIEEPSDMAEFGRTHEDKLQRALSDIRSNRVAVEGNLVAKGLNRVIGIDDDMHTVYRIKPTDGERQIMDHMGMAIPLDSAAEPVHNLDVSDVMEVEYLKQKEEVAGKVRSQGHEMHVDAPYLNVGTSSEAAESQGGMSYAVCESPGAVEFGIYQQAYEDEIGRILAEQESKGGRPTIYLTRRVESIPHLREHEDITNHDRLNDG